MILTPADPVLIREHGMPVPCYVILSRWHKRKLAFLNVFFLFSVLHNQVVSKTKGYNLRECAPRQKYINIFILENVLVAIILTRYLFCVKEQSLERNTCQLL